MLTILSDMFMTASGQAHKETGRRHPPRGTDHWAGGNRLDTRDVVSMMRPRRGRHAWW